MNIFIPSHIRRDLKIVDQMCKMIENFYENNENGINTDPYYYYYTSINYDPVKKFIGICLSDRLLKEETTDWDNIFNYLTKLFYSVKGCPEEIFKYLSDHVGLDIRNYSYDVVSGEVIVLIGKIPLSDKNSEKFFRDSFRSFLMSLLLVNSFSLNIDEAELNIVEALDINFKSKLYTYNIITTELSSDDNIILKLTS